MNEFRYISTKYPKTDRELPLKQESRSPDTLFRNRDATLQGHLLNTSSSDSVFPKSNIKQELVSLKTLPKSEYRSRLSSLLSNLSIPSSPMNSFSLSPRGKDSTYLNSEPVQNSKRNVILKPLYKVSNSVTRAGYKIHNALINGHHTAILIKGSFHNIKGKYMFCLADSHGPESRMILEYLKKNLLGLLEQHIHVEPEPGTKSFMDLDEFLMGNIKEAEINLNFSGCSLLNLMVYGDSYYIWNIGDCQAVLAKEIDSWKCKTLNNPHSLKNQQEKTRIIEFGGKIQESTSGQGKIEKFDLGGSKSPRFHLTRSIGDVSGKPIGISSRAEVIKFSIRPEDRFIIIANSRFWDLVSAPEAVSIAQEGWIAKRTDVVCESLTKFAESRIQELGIVDEDLAVIVLFFNH